MFPRSATFLCAAALAAVTARVAQPEPAPDKRAENKAAAAKPAEGEPTKQGAIRYPAEHRVIEVEGWPVEVDERLLEGEEAASGCEALRVLEAKLRLIALAVPEEALAKLRKIRIRVDAEHPLKTMQYHPSVEWLREHGYDPALAKVVHIPRAKSLVGHARRNDQPWVVLHELAHAYHDQFLGFDEERIRKAYERARESGKYESVLHISGRKVRHYALTNHKEFFAELTECYFGTNDFYPFVRAEFKEFDPESYAVIEEAWGRKTEK